MYDRLFFAEALSARQVAISSKYDLIAAVESPYIDPRPLPLQLELVYVDIVENLRTMLDYF